MRKRLTLVALGMLGSILLSMHVQAADAATQPYGGCKEAYVAPHSTGAQDCREAGWTIRMRLVVGPHGYVHYSRLPHCLQEDGSGQGTACTWNLGPGRDGNGKGRKYWIDERDRTHYVKGWARR